MPAETIAGRPPGALASIFLTGACSLLAAPALGQITFFPQRDTFITGQRTTRNYGSCPLLQTNKEASQPDRALLRFDLSSIPMTSTINSAILQLTKTGGDMTSQNVEAHRVTVDWSEGSVCDTGGAASWNDRQTSVAWATAGGDYSATVEATTAVSVNGVYTWNLTALVQAWVNGSQANHGVLLRVDVETGGNRTQEYASDETAVSADRPRLIVDTIPTTVTLFDFSTKVSGGRVVVGWGTTSEVGTLGFHLYRQDRVSGDWVRVNRWPLSADSESPQGATYECVDVEASPEQAETYLLVEIEEGGRQRHHGPFRVEPTEEGLTVPSKGGSLSRSDPRRPASPESESSRNRRGSAVLQASTLPEDGASLVSRWDRGRHAGPRRHPTGALPALKVATGSAGAHVLTAQELADAWQQPVGTIRAWIRKGQVSISRQGAPVAWLQLRNGVGLLFYAEAPQSIYSRRSIYWVSRGSAGSLPMDVVRGRRPAVTADDLSFIERAHFEEDRFAATVLSRDPEADYWYWDSLSAGDVRKGFQLPLHDIAATSGTAELEVRLSGASETAAPMDHHVRVLLNGVEVGDTRFDGIGAHTAVFSFAQELLVDAGNWVELEAVADTGAPHSFVYVDGFDVLYQRRMRAFEDRLAFSASGQALITIPGFTDPDIHVFEVTDPGSPRAVERVRVDRTDSYRVSFVPPDPNGGYIAVSNSALSRPEAIWRDRASVLRSSADGAEQLVIAAPSLVDAAEELARYRRERGVHSAVVSLEDVWDEFSYGEETPHALRRFLDHAWWNWGQRPRSVVLAGAGTFDYRDQLGLGGNLVSPLMVSTPFGLFASDSRFGDLDSEAGSARIAVGRIPARSPEELLAYVEKLRAFERSGPQARRDRALLLADDGDGAGDFSANNELLAALLPPGLPADRIELSSLTTAQARQQLFEGLESGVGWVNYIGHGGVDRLAAEGLLTTEDVSSLRNQGRTPILTSFSCATGRFELPQLDSLAEVLVLDPNGGSIAVWSPAGLSLDPEAALLNRLFARALFQQHAKTLGEAITATGAAYGQEGHASWLPWIYNLIGDPESRID